MLELERMVGKLFVLGDFEKFHNDFCETIFTYVPAVPLVAGVTWHVEPVLVVGEVVSDFVVARACHVGHPAGHGLDLLQEAVSHFALVPVQVVRKVTHVQYRVIESLQTY